MNLPPTNVVDTPQSRCRFAMAWSDITPPADIYHRMWGAASHERASGIHRPLRATVTIFEPLDPPKPIVSSAERQVLIALDHCVLGAVELDQLMTALTQSTGLSSEVFLVVFSHTHSAGLMSLERAELPGGDRIPPYLKLLGTQVADLIQRCLRQLEPVTLVYGMGRCSLARHRDYWDPNLAQFVCGFNPDHPADDTVLVAKVIADSGRLAATLVNYACHPTTLAWENTLVSPDYIGALREVVEEEFAAPCLFLQGACGELGPKEGFVGDTAVADRNGRELGFAAVAALTALPPPGTQFRYAGPIVSGATLGTWTHSPLSHSDRLAHAYWNVSRWSEPLPYRADQPSISQVETELQQYQSEERAARARGDELSSAAARAMAERKRRLRHRLAQLPPGDSYPLQVVIWRIGNAIWVGVQGESYSILQTELRRRFPNQVIIVASIAADWGASYLPPRTTYGKNIYQETIAVVAPGSLEQLIDAIASRIATL